jgi:hypothetical protein
MPIPIPKRPSGYVKGAARTVHFDAFVSIQRPYSKKAWATLLAVFDGHDPWRFCHVGSFIGDFRIDLRCNTLTGRKPKWQNCQN